MFVEQKFGVLQEYSAATGLCCGLYGSASWNSKKGPAHGFLPGLALPLGRMAVEVGAEHCELKDLETLTPLDVSVIQGMRRKQISSKI